MRNTGLVTAEVKEFFHVLWHSMLINEFLPGFFISGILNFSLLRINMFSFFFFAMIWLASGRGMDVHSMYVFCFLSFDLLCLKIG